MTSLPSSDTEMKARVPGLCFHYPAAIFSATIGGVAMALVGFGMVIVEGVFLALVGVALVGLDRYRCELSYWWGRQDECEYGQETRDTLLKHVLVQRKAREAKRAEPCSSADCDGTAVGQVEYCRDCIEALWRADHRVRKTDPEEAGR